jgi:hypothetical protein
LIAQTAIGDKPHRYSPTLTNFEHGNQISIEQRFSHSLQLDSDQVGKLVENMVKRVGIDMFYGFIPVSYLTVGTFKVTVIIWLDVERNW